MARPVRSEASPDSSTGALTAEQADDLFAYMRRASAHMFSHAPAENREWLFADELAMYAASLLPEFDGADWFDRAVEDRVGARAMQLHGLFTAREMFDAILDTCDDDLLAMWVWEDLDDDEEYDYVW